MPELSPWLQLMLAEVLHRREAEGGSPGGAVRRKMATPVVEANPDDQQQQTGGNRNQWLKGSHPA